jgi:hypothetical protein
LELFRAEEAVWEHGVIYTMREAGNAENRFATASWSSLTGFAASGGRARKNDQLKISFGGCLNRIT